MATDLDFSDWDSVVEELRRFGEGGDVTTGEGWVRVEFGSAHVELAREGRLSTGMPLHEFEREGAVDLVVDHDAGTITVEAEDVTYTFRRPGG